MGSLVKEKGRVNSLGLLQLPHSSVLFKNMAAELFLAFSNWFHSLPLNSSHLLSSFSFFQIRHFWLHGLLLLFLFFPAGGVWNLLIKQTWLEILVGACLRTKNVPLDSVLAQLYREACWKLAQGIWGGGHWGSGPGWERTALKLGVSQTHWADLCVGNAGAACARLRKRTGSFRQQTVNGQWIECLICHPGSLRDWQT